MGKGVASGPCDHEGLASVKGIDWTVDDEEVIISGNEAIVTSEGVQEVLLCLTKDTLKIFDGKATLTEISCHDFISVYDMVSLEGTPWMHLSSAEGDLTLHVHAPYHSLFSATIQQDLNNTTPASWLGDVGYSPDFLKDMEATATRLLQARQTASPSSETAGQPDAPEPERAEADEEPKKTEDIDESKEAETSKQEDAKSEEAEAAPSACTAEPVTETAGSEQADAPPPADDLPEQETAEEPCVKPPVDAVDPKKREAEVADEIPAADEGPVAEIPVADEGPAADEIPVAEPVADEGPAADEGTAISTEEPKLKDEPSEPADKIPAEPVETPAEEVTTSAERNNDNEDPDAQEAGGSDAACSQSATEGCGGAASPTVLNELRRLQRSHTALEEETRRKDILGSEEKAARAVQCCMDGEWRMLCRDKGQEGHAEFQQLEKALVYLRERWTEVYTYEREAEQMQYLLALEGVRREVIMEREMAVAWQVMAGIDTNTVSSPRRAAGSGNADVLFERKQGWVLKAGPTFSSWHKKYIVLVNGNVYALHKPDDARKKPLFCLSAVEKVELDAYRASSVVAPPMGQAGRTLGFYVTLQVGTTFRFCALCAADRTAWMSLLRTGISKPSSPSSSPRSSTYRGAARNRDLSYDSRLPPFAEWLRSPQRTGRVAL